MLLQSIGGINSDNTSKTQFFGGVDVASRCGERCLGNLLHCQHFFEKIAIRKNVLQVLTVLTSPQFTGRKWAGGSTLHGEVLTDLII